MLGGASENSFAPDISIVRPGEKQQFIKQHDIRTSLYIRDRVSYTDISSGCSLW